MQDNTVRFGGVLTVNWHDRSLAPERLWDSPYRDLLAGMKSRRAWFSTASQAVSWFRKRRSATFEIDTTGQPALRVNIPADQTEILPPLKLRTYNKSSATTDESHTASNYVDTPVNKAVQTSVVFGAN